MSIRYRDKNGAETVVGGLTPGGDLAFGASTTRSGTVSIPSIAGSSSAELTVTFDEPLPRDDYEVELHGTAYFNLGRIANKTENGFTVTVRNTTSSSYTGTLDYYAFLLYDVEHAEQNASDIADIKAKIPSTASSSNKLATSNELSSLGTTIDGRLDTLEDTIPSSASLQNQLITETELTTALQGKQDTLTFDTTPTEDSSNPVTSDGIKDAIDGTADDIYKVMSKNGAKNLLPNTVVSKAISGITYTKNSNGSVTINGTSTGWGQNDVGKCLLPKGTYTISVGVTVPSGVFFTLRNDDADSSILNLGNGGTETKRDFTLASDTNIRLYCGISGNVTVSNITFYPMVYLSSDTDSTYQPYSLTNQQITPYIQAISNPNLLDNPWFTVNQRGFSTSVSSAYGYDRWIGIYKYSADGVLLSGAEYIIQNFESDFKNFLNGKIITASVLYSDGTIESGSATYNKSPGDIIQIIFSAKVSVQINSYGNFTITARSSITNDITIRAVKLELGNASTLANDIAPNYATELEKCRRYFRSIYIAELLARINDGGANIRFPSMLIDGLRPGSKTVRFKDESNPDFYVRLSGGGTQFTLIWNTDFSLAIDGDSGMNINFALTADGKEKVKNLKNQIVGIWNYSNYIWVSADL